MKKKLSDIPGYENCTNYTLYSDGRVYSSYKEDFLKLPKDSKGYEYLDIRRSKSKLKCPKIHQLIMLAFSDSDIKDQINHIDGDKTNNDISNLEYVTNRENREHAIRTGLKNEIYYGIAQYDLNGNFLNVYATASEALKHIGVTGEPSGNIGRAIRGHRKTAYGYIWKQCEGSTTIKSVSGKHRRLSE